MNNKLKNFIQIPLQIASKPLIKLEGGEFLIFIKIAGAPERSSSKDNFINNELLLGSSWRSHLNSKELLFNNFIEKFSEACNRLSSPMAIKSKI